jgi:hypothetical protein
MSGIAVGQDLQQLANDIALMKKVISVQQQAILGQRVLYKTKSFAHTYGNVSMPFDMQAYYDWNNPTGNPYYYLNQKHDVTQLGFINLEPGKTYRYDFRVEAFVNGPAGLKWEIYSDVATSKVVGKVDMIFGLDPSGGYRQPTNLTVTGSVSFIATTTEKSVTLRMKPQYFDAWNSFISGSTSYKFLSGSATLTEYPSNFVEVDKPGAIQKNW